MRKVLAALLAIFGNSRFFLSILKSIPEFQMLERLSEACRSNTLLGTQRIEPANFGDTFCVADCFWTAKPFRFSAITLVNLSDKTCKILGSFLQCKAIFLQKITSILQKVQEMQFLGRFWQETSDLSTFSARNVCWADQTFSCKILSRILQDFKKLAKFLCTCKITPLL